MDPVPGVEGTLVKRVIKKAYEDEFCVYNLSWIDDEVAMIPLPEYADKEIVDTRVNPIRTARLQNIWNKKPEVECPQPRGRKRAPITEILPVMLKRGRPKIDMIHERNLVFENFQTFKSIISKETTKSNRLVTLKPVKIPTGVYRYSCKEISSFYISVNDINNIRNNSWRIIKKFEIIYNNVLFKIPKDYTLPDYFVSKDFYTPENIAKRKAQKLQTQNKVMQFHEKLRQDEFDRQEFTSKFDRLTNFRFIRNKDIDEKMKGRFFYKKKSQGDQKLKNLTEEEIKIFEESYKIEYEKLADRREKLRNDILALDEVNPEVNATVKRHIFSIVDPKTLFQTDKLSMNQLNEIDTKYFNLYQKILNKKTTQNRELVRQELDEFIKIFHKIDPDINNAVKKELLKPERLEQLEYGDLNTLKKRWKFLFDKIHKRMLAKLQKRCPDDVDE